MESQQKECILQVGADQFTISMESVLRTFGSKIEMFLDTRSQTHTKYVIRRPKDSTMALIEYCYTGQLHIPQNVCKGEFKTELAFWGLRHTLLETCCYHKFCSYLNDQKNLKWFENMYRKSESSNTGHKRNVKERVWGIVNCDQKSKCSKVYFCMSTTFVLLVIAVLAITSMNDVDETGQQNMSAQPDVDLTPSTTSSVPLPKDSLTAGSNTPSGFDTNAQAPRDVIYHPLIINVRCEICSYLSSGSPGLSPTDKTIDYKAEHTDIHLHIPKCCKSYLVKALPISRTKIFDTFTESDDKDYDAVSLSPTADPNQHDNETAMNQTNESNGTQLHPRSAQETSLPGTNDTSNGTATPSVDQSLRLTNISIIAKLTGNITTREHMSIIATAILETISISKNKLSSFTSILTLSNITNNEHILFYYMERVTTVFFTAEFVIRLIACPNKKEFLRGVLNWLDLILLLGCFGRILLELWSDLLGTMTLVYDLFLYLQMLRVFRLFRAIEHVKAFKVLRYSLVIGLKDICVLTMYVLVTMCIFSNFIYFVEEKSNFPSIPAAWWWSIVTMTTVGYGDMVPQTVLGKLIGSLCALSGVVLFSLIIPVFVSTFLTAYEYANGSRDEEDQEDSNQKVTQQVSAGKQVTSLCNVEVQCPQHHDRQTASLCNVELVCDAGERTTRVCNDEALCPQHQPRQTASLCNVEVQCPPYDRLMQNSNGKLQCKCSVENLMTTQL